MVDSKPFKRETITDPHMTSKSFLQETLTDPHMASKCFITGNPY